jgi:hypothetical protein
MDIFGILFLLFVLTLIVLVIVGMVKAGRTMGWQRIVACSFLFLFSVIFLFMSAATANRRLASQKLYAEAKKRNEDLLSQVALLKFGDLNDVANDDESLLYTLSELKEVTIDRGRVWRHSVWQNYDAASNAYTVQTVADGDAVPQDLPDQIVVYAFGENTQDDGQLLPDTYLGEFQVVSSAGGSAQLRPTRQLLDSQLAAIDDGFATKWTIYELMPLDSHIRFAAPGSEPSQDELFGRMDEGQLAELLEIDPSLMDVSGNTAPEALATDPDIRKGALLRSYTKDGSIDENPPPRFRWIRLQFEKDNTIDVDSKEARSALDGGYFDLSGRTVDSRLKRGEELASITFKAGDEIVLWDDAAQQLIDRGVAKLVSRYFVRPLNDYEAGLASVAQRLLETRQNAAVVEREMEITRVTNEKINQEIGLRQAERIKLDANQVQYEKEQSVITAEAVRLEAELADMRLRLKKTYEEIQRTHRELVAINRG